ncbi:MAG TPA: FAD-binding oxidoreductase [Nitrolancea sp.]
MTPTPGTTVGTATDVNVAALEARLLGRLIRPDDRDYDEARQVMNALIDRRPDYIVRAADAADVIRAIEFARSNNLPLAVRSSGHSFSGHGTVDDGVVVDLSEMNAISVDPGRRTVWAQPGATSADLAAATQPHGLAFSTGDTGSVALGGLATGGGIGLLSRKFGLSIDSLRAVELVTADSRLIVADAAQHPDLFWAIRGGGGNFGIVTGFEFDLHPVGMVLGGALILPATTQVIRRFADYAVTAPDELTMIGSMMRTPPLPMIPAEMHGKPAFFILACYAGDLEEGERVMAPLRELAAPIADTIHPMPYSDIFKLGGEGSQPSPITIKGGFVDELSDGAIETLLDDLFTAFDPFAMVQLRPLGGAIARLPNDATAFAHRDKSFALALINIGVERENQQWVDRMWGALKPEVSGAYVNFVGDEGQSRVADAYPPETYARLAEVKRQYDPTNLFKLNQNIQPTE